MHLKLLPHMHALTRMLTHTVALHEQNLKGFSSRKLLSGAWVTRKRDIIVTSPARDIIWCQQQGRL
jgi:hypothetical protein